MTASLPRARASRGPASWGAVASFAVLVAVALSAAAPASAYDPAVVSLSMGYPEANTSAASIFRLALEENLTACAWPGCHDLNRSDEVHIAATGPGRIGGSTVATYDINVSGVAGNAQNYTTIAVVLKTDLTGVVMTVDESGELAGNVAYTKLLNGSSTMRVNLIGPNATSNLSLYIFGYVGDGNQTTHDDHQVYNLEVKQVETRATRTVPLNVTVSNSQNISLSGVPVSFYVKGPNDSEFALAGNTTISTLTANGNATAVINWDATWADNAVYTVKAVVDPQHLFPETRDDNNIRFFQVNLGPEVSSGPEDPGEVFGYGVLVAVGAVVVGLWWYNRRYE